LSLPVRTVCKLLSPLIMVYACYLVVTGVQSPGGAFAGGVVAGVAVCLMIVAEEKGIGFFTRVRWVVSVRNLAFGLLTAASCVTLAVTGRFLETAMLAGAGTLLASPGLVFLGLVIGALVGSEMIIALGEMLGITEES